MFGCVGKFYTCCNKGGPNNIYLMLAQNHKNIESVILYRTVAYILCESIKVKAYVTKGGSKELQHEKDTKWMQLIEYLLSHWAYDTKKKIAYTLFTRASHMCGAFDIFLFIKHLNCSPAAK